MAKKRGQWGMITGALVALIVIGVLGVVGPLVIEGARTTAVAINATSLAVSTADDALDGIVGVTQWLELAGVVVAAAFILAIIMMFQRNQ